MSSYGDQLLYENKFPCIGMDVEQRDCCLNILNHCEDICNTENKVDNLDKCEICQMHFRQENGVITFSGILKIGSENRTILGEMYIEEDKFVVYYEITRINVECERKQYSVIDEFKLENDILKRVSKYSYNDKSKCYYINDESMKGRLR